MYLYKDTDEDSQHNVCHYTHCDFNVAEKLDTSDKCVEQENSEIIPEEKMEVSEETNVERQLEAAVEEVSTIHVHVHVCV